jgi:hypothetical protein
MNDDPHHHAEGLDHLPPDERDVLRNYRKQKAEEAKLDEHWTVVVEDLNKASADVIEEEAWDAVTGRFWARVKPHGWEKDEIAAFTFALMRSLGFGRKGRGWALTR